MPTADVERYCGRRRACWTSCARDLARLRRLVPATETVKLDAQGEAIRSWRPASRCRWGPRAAPARSRTMPMSFDMSGMGASGTLAPTGHPSTLSGVDYYVAGGRNDPTMPRPPPLAAGHVAAVDDPAAFACDLVRVATFMWSAGTNWVVFPGTFNGKTISRRPAVHARTTRLSHDDRPGDRGLAGGVRHLVRAAVRRRRSRPWTRPSTSTATPCWTTPWWCT